jgi:hypothetical protein
MELLDQQERQALLVRLDLLVLQAKLDLLAITVRLALLVLQERLDQLVISVRQAQLVILEHKVQQTSHGNSLMDNLFPNLLFLALEAGDGLLIHLNLIPAASIFHSYQN